jgi:phosphatidylglycerol:prolipoprotein diacylglycerol transferase
MDITHMPLTIVIDLDPNIARLGPFLITWHGVFSVLGIIAAARLGFWLLAKDRVDVRNSGDGLAWMVVVGLAGARLLYVWENFKLFSGNLLRAFALTEGGISQWGGLFGAIVGAYIWARRGKFSFWKIIDAGGPAAMIGLAIGRIGDVINGEHHGTPTTLPWGVQYVNANTLGEPGKVVHPEVAYEMVLCLAILALILPFHQRLKARLPDGVLGLVYLGVYAAGRFALSYLRADPAIIFGLRQAQLASALMVVLALIAVPVLFRMRARANFEPATAIPDRA